MAKLHSKRGDTLVEVVVSVAVLGIVVVGVLMSISFSRQAILQSNSADRVSAQAQEIADTLTADLTGLAQSDYNGAIQQKLKDDTGAQLVGGAPDSSAGEKQFSCRYLAADAQGIAGWEITASVRLKTGFVTLRAFAPVVEGGGAA